MSDAVPPPDATRRAIDLQALLGVGALALSERNLVLALVAAAFYGLLTLWPRLAGGPPPRLGGRWSNLGAAVAVGVLVLEATRPGAELVVAMGHFTVMLQGLLLAGPRRGRDDAMLLVLGLIQILASSVLSSTVLDGLALMAWCAAAAAALVRLSMRGAERRVTRHNRADPAGGTAAGPRPPSIGRVFLVGVTVAGAVAAAVFVATPRRDAGHRAQAHAALGGLRGAGFPTRVELGVAAPRRVLDGPVMHVTIRQGGGNIGRDGRDFLLRGAALDRYEADGRSWVRSAAVTRRDVVVRLGPGTGGRLDLASSAPPRAAAGTRWDVETLQRGGSLGTLFLPTARMMAGGTPLAVEVEGARSLGFNAIDRRLEVVDRGEATPDRYRLSVAPLRNENLAEAYARFRPPGLARPAGSAEPGRGGRARLDGAPAWLRPLLAAAVGGGGAGGGTGAEAGGPRPPEGDPGRQTLKWEVEPERVAALADHVLSAAGLARPPGTPPGPGDRRRVERLEHFLRTNFRYTLDNPPVRAGVDPVIDFLFERREGHCELFAAGLVALCRSVGIPARVVTGYRAGEFNGTGGYYVVRQEHAHAWAEAALGVAGPAGGAGGLAGWTTFDATPPARVRAEHQRGGPAWFRRLRHLAEHAEYTWVSRVVAFGPETRDRAFAAVRGAAADLFQDRLGWTRWIPRGAGVRALTSSAAVGASLLAVGAAFAVLRRHRGSRRRAAERPAAFAGPATPPARLLGFYARLLGVLEREGQRRPPRATPRAWAAGLARRDPDRFGGVPAVTEAFYRVRFGGQTPDARELRRIDALIAQVGATPPSPSSPASPAPSEPAP